MRVKMTPEEARDYARVEMMAARVNEARAALAARVCARVQHPPEAVTPDGDTCEWVVPDPPAEKPPEPAPEPEPAA